jgi:hypothetical protein
MAVANAGAAAPQLTNDQVQKALGRLRRDQSLGGALGAGAVASLVGAVVWAVVTDVTGYQIGFMAIGVGFLVGYGVRMAGKGIDKTFGFLGAGLALVGCVVGNALAMLGLVAEQENLSYGALWSQIDLPTMVNLMVVTFSPMDLLFYGIAIYEGYKLSFRRLTPADLKAVGVG